MTQVVAGFDTERLQAASWKHALQYRARRRKLTEELASVLTPAVLQYLPAPLQLEGGPQAVDDWIDARNAESDVLTIRECGPSALIGLLILAPLEEPDATRTVHLGYLLAEQAWGRGYATELLQGLVEALGGQGRPATLLAGVEPGNAASARVLQKAGFHLDADLSIPGTDMFRLDL